MSPDLKLATVYVMPLGGKDGEAGASRRSSATSKFLRGEIAAAREPEVRARRALPPRRPASTGRARSTRSCARPRCSAISTRPRSDDRGRRGMSRMNAPRSKRVDVNGWLVLDKPVGMTSTHAVARREAAVQRQEGRPCRHARSARLRHPADRLRRGDQDRALRVGRREGLPLHGALGRRDRHRRHRRQGRRARQRRCARRGTTIEAVLPRFTGDDHAGAADVLRHQDRRRARLRSRPRRRGGRARAARRSTIDRCASSSRDADDAVLRGRMRQGHLCPRHRPRPRPRARLPRPRHGAAPHPRRALQRWTTPSRWTALDGGARSGRRSRCCPSRAA